MSIEKIIPIDKELVNIFGVNDQNLKYLKDKFKNENIYFVDNSHPSTIGADMINNLIVAEIKKISN